MRSSEWFNVQLLEQYKKKYGGFRTDYYQRYNLINGVKAGIEGLLAQHGFILTFENKNYPSYKMKSWLDKIVFEKGDERIEFRQADWRDYTNYYHLYYNGKELCIFDTHKTANVQHIVQEIKSSLKFDTHSGI